MRLAGAGRHRRFLRTRNGLAPPGTTVNKDGDATTVYGCGLLCLQRFAPRDDLLQLLRPRDLIHVARGSHRAHVLLRRRAVLGLVLLLLHLLVVLLARLVVHLPNPFRSENTHLRASLSMPFFHYDQ